MAAHLDAVVESPISTEAIIDGVEKAPHAAAAVVGLLRNIEALPLRTAVHLESICFAMLQGSAEHAAWLAGQTPSPAEASGEVLIERDGDVLRLLIDRPHALNAIDRQLRDALVEAFTLAGADPEIKRVVLRGRGRAFSMGADLAEFGTTRDPASAHLIRLRTLPALALLNSADRLEVRVQGACVGSGLEMAAFAHRIVARRDAWFQLPELAMGIMPGAGGCVSVPRRIGRQRATLMILSGRRIDAATALRWGLVDAVVDAAAFDEDGADML